MVYLITLIGFMLGFGIGLGTINVLLMKRTKKEIQEDTNLRWKYGTLVWVLAIMGGFLGYWLFNQHYF